MKASNSQKTAAAHTSSPSERTNTLLQEDHPAKKRQRTRQACDECRREKTKCDGNQPCAHCLGYGYHCSYDHLSPRKIRKGESQLAERKLRRLQELLKSLIPDIDVDDPNLDVADLRKALVPPRKEHSDEQKCLEEPEYLPSVSNRSSTDEDPVLETILELTGRLDIDEHGNWDYLGHSSGSLFLRRLGEQFCGLHNSGSINKKNLLKLQPTLQAFETFEETFSDGYISILTPLPPKETALDLVSSTLDDACALINFVHQPSFYNMFHRMYDVDFEEYGHREKEFLPLLYAVLAVGYVFSERELMNFGNAHSTSQGAKYFQACKRIFDLSGCHNLPSLQAVVFMIIFLQSSGNMSTCYTYIGTALAASLQMGLHRRDGSQVLDPVERESRKRIFWTIRNMEIYVVAILGLPMSVNDEDIDQEEPLGVDDEFITKEGITTMPEGRISIISAFNAHTKLIRILEKVVRDVYPIRHGIEDTTRKPSTYIVSDASVRAVEAELEDWEAKLPVQFRVGSDASPKLTRIQHLLRMALTHVRMVLYRPFLHYTSRSMMERPINERCRVYASASVAVGRNIIENVREMGERSNFSGPYWFSIYTIFFATISLSFHAWENAGCEGALKMLKDAECGRDMLAHLAHRSMSAARCSKTLETVFTQLPERLRKIQTERAGSYKLHLLPRNSSQLKSAYGCPDKDAHRLDPLRKDKSHNCSQTLSSTEHLSSSNGPSPHDEPRHSTPHTNLHHRNNLLQFSASEMHSMAPLPRQFHDSNSLSWLELPILTCQSPSFTDGSEDGCQRVQYDWVHPEQNGDDLSFLYPLSPNLTHPFPSVFR